MPRQQLIALFAGFALLILVSSSLFTIQETEQALVLQFGEAKRVIQTPGLKAKLPWEEVMRFDKRLLDVEPSGKQITLADQKRIEVDTFARYVIKDPLKFFQTVRNENNADIRLSNIIDSSVRRVLGNVSLSSVLSDDRVRIMADIRGEVGEASRPFGVEIVDVRIRRADLPQETSQAIYNRMISERDREAKEFRAKGAQMGAEIRANADRERTILLAEATRDAQKLRGEGDAEAIKHYADALNIDPEFYSFYRSLEAYRNSLANSDTSLILSPNSRFFKFMDQGGGKR
ncbi:MAG: protease modulator HflC [Holosporaceae bacterium]|jgi:membrane protease subunit HflC|nr:protease modulator HflC [Rhodospirillaceae bacterium]